MKPVTMMRPQGPRGCNRKEIKDLNNAKIFQDFLQTKFCKQRHFETWNLWAFTYFVLLNEKLAEDDQVIKSIIKVTTAWIKNIIATHQVGDLIDLASTLKTITIDQGNPQNFKTRKVRNNINQIWSYFHILLWRLVALQSPQ